MQPERRKTSLFCSLAIGALASSLFVLPAHAEGDLGSAPAVTAPVTAWREADVAALRNALACASAHGLDASELRKALRTTSPEDAARMDRIALTYARALAFGVVDPKRLHETFSLEVNQRALEGELNAALRQGRATTRTTTTGRASCPTAKTA